MEVNLREKINFRIFKDSFELFGINGERVSNERFILQYVKIRNYLSQKIHVGGSIAICLDKNENYFLTMLACMEVGIVYIPLSCHYPEKRIQQIQEDTQFQMLFDQDTFDLILSQTEREYTPHPINECSPLYIIFTSGSTGRPKGVVISRGAAKNFCFWLSDYFNKIDKTDHLLQVTEFTFDISLIDVFLFITNNVKVYFSEFKGNIFTLAWEIEQYQISVLNSVPNNFNMLLEADVFERFDSSSLKTLMIGGARFSLGLYKRVTTHFKHLNVYNFYGPTEFTIYSHIKKIEFNENDVQKGVVSIGHPVVNCVSKILYSENEDKGELLLGGRQLMNQYVNSSQRTKEVLKEIDQISYYCTGDVAFTNEEGEFFIVGRMDDTIKHRGYRINLSDIDSYILKISYIQDCATIAVPDEYMENKLISFYIKEKKVENKSVGQIKKEMSQYLLDYQIPEELISVEVLPVNSSGKICKKTLLNQYLATGTN